MKFKAGSRNPKTLNNSTLDLSKYGTLRVKEGIVTGELAIQIESQNHSPEVGYKDTGDPGIIPKASGTDPTAPLGTTGNNKELLASTSSAGVQIDLSMVDDDQNANIPRPEMPSQSIV